MTSKTSTAGGLFFLFTFIFLVVLMYWSYFNTPQAGLSPFIYSLVFFIFSFLLGFGEYLGAVAPMFAKKNFLTRGGLVAVYEKHEEGQGGMVTYFFSVRGGYLKHCNYFEYAEVSAFKRFMLMLTPTMVARITDRKEMFEEVAHASSDTPEGTIFYHGTLRGVNVSTFEESLRIKLDKATKVISELWTIFETAKAGLEASSQGSDKQLINATTTLSTAMENLDKYRKESGNVIMMPGQEMRR